MKKRHFVSFYGLLAFWLAAVPTLRAADLSDAEKNIAELYKSGKLFDKTQYKAVRAAFSLRFEDSQQTPIRAAFGEDYDKLTDWLNAHPDVKEELYTALDETTDKVQLA